MHGEKNKSNFSVFSGKNCKLYVASTCSYVDVELEFAINILA